jgi:hypothetical protein
MSENAHRASVSGKVGSQSLQGFSERREVRKKMEARTAASLAKPRHDMPRLHLAAVGARQLADRHGAGGGEGGVGDFAHGA